MKGSEESLPYLFGILLFIFSCCTLTRIIFDDAINKSIRSDKAQKFFLWGIRQSKNILACLLVISHDDLLLWLCNTEKIK